MRNRLKRFLALVVTTLMFVNMMPVNVLAEQNNPTLYGEWIGNQGVDVLAVGDDFEITADSSYVLVGGELQLRVPEGYSVEEWTSTNPTVATVNDSGLVSAHAKGSSHIIAATADGQSARFTVTVVDGKYQIRYNVVYPEDARNFIYNENVTTRKPEDTTIVSEIDAIPGSEYVLRNDIDCYTHRVVAWETSDGTQYAPGETIVINGNLDLSPVWESKGYLNGTITLRYREGNTGSAADRNHSLKAGISATVPMFYTVTPGSWGQSTYTIYVQVHKNQETVYDDVGKTGGTLKGYTTERGSSDVEVEQGGILVYTYTGSSQPREIVLYPIFQRTNNICQFYLLKPSQQEGSFGEVAQNYYFVGLGTVSEDAQDVVPNLPNKAWGSGDVSGDVTNARVSGRTYDFLGDAPSVEQVLSYLGESAPGGTNYTVRWYKVCIQDDGWHIDGILVNQGITHTIRYVDTANGAVLFEENVEDATRYNFYENEPEGNELSGPAQAFIGWFFDEEGQYPVTSDSIGFVSEDYTIYALYEDIVTVQYRDDEGELYEGDEYPEAYQSVVVGEDGTLVDWEPTKPGYTFIGWRDSLDSNEVLEESKMLGMLTNMQDDAVFYATFEENISIEGQKVWEGKTGTANGRVELGVYVDLDGELTKVDFQPNVTWDRDNNFYISDLPYLTQGSYVVREMSGDQPVAEGETIAFDGTSYTVSYDGYTITNAVANGELTIYKTLYGGEGGEEFTFTVAKDGETVETVTVTVGANGEGSETLSLEPGAYTVTENDEDGYTLLTDNGVSVEITAGEVKEVFFTNTVSDVSVTATKVWKDGLGENRPESVFVQLCQNEVDYGAPAKLSKDGWSHTWYNLPEFDVNGEKYAYTVKEVGEMGGSVTHGTVEYDVAYNGYEITNTITDPKDVTVSGTKTWVDGGKEHSNEDEIELTLYRQSAKPGSTKEEVENATPTWEEDTYTFSGLEKYDGEGYAYTYSVEEAGVVNGQITINDVVYDVTYGANNAIINTIHDDKDVTVSGTKTWFDGDAEVPHDNSEDVQLTLYRQSATVDKKAVDAMPTWEGNTYTFSGLEKYDGDGYAYTYSVEEAKIEGYTTVQDGYNFTNTAETATVTVRKVWNDQDDAYGLRPDSVVVTLTGTVEGETEPVATYAVTLSADDWTATKAVRTHDGKGNPITYAVTETVPSGYTAAYSTPIVPAEDGSKLTVTNTLDTVDVTIQKIVPGSETERTFTIGYVIALGEAEVSGTAELANEETKIITVPKGATVTVSENEPGWEATISDNNGEAFSENGTITVTNKRTTVTQLSVEKVWQVPEGMEMLTPALNVTITRHVEGGEPEMVGAVELTEDNGWTKDLEGAFETHDENGNPYIYTATEETADPAQQDALDAYTFSATPAKPAEGKTEIVLTNAVADDNTVTVIITKNVDGPDGGRTFDIDYTVAMGGAEISRGMAELKNGASETITVPKGATVTVSEDPGEGWEVSYQRETESGVYQPSMGTETFDANGKIVVVNTRELFNGDGELTVTKVWADGDHAFARPEVFFDLYGMVGTGDSAQYLTLSGSQEVLSAEKAAYKTLALGEAESVTFAKLPARTANGQEIDWIVEERMEGAEGYTWTSETTGDAENGFTFTNTLKLMNVVVDKTWQLNGIELSEYPKVKVELSVGVTSVGTATFAQDDEGRWTATFENVPYRESGYTVKETSITGGKVEAVNASETAAELFTEMASAEVGEPATEDGVLYTATASLVNKAHGENGEELGALTVTKVLDLSGAAWTGGYPTFEFAAEFGNQTVEFELTPAQNDGAISATSQQILVPVESGVTVTETPVAGWTADAEEKTVQAGEDGAYAVFTNTLDTMDITVNKGWEDRGGDSADRPEVVFALYSSDGTTPVTKNGVEMTAEPDENGVATFEGVPYSKDGYVVKEVMSGNVVGYVSSWKNDSATVAFDADGAELTVTNTRTLAEVTVAKTIEDNTTDSKKGKASKFIFAIYDGEVEVDRSEPIGDGGEASFTVEIGKAYNLVELAADGKPVNTNVWTVSGTGEFTVEATDDADGVTIKVTNTRKTTSLSMTKTWVDDSNKNKTRPTEITLIAQRQGADGDWTTVTAAGREIEEVNSGVDTETYTELFGNLPAYDLNGQKIAYRVNEAAASIAGDNGASYKPEVSVNENGVTEITNKLNAGSMGFSVTKNWVDASNAEEIRPMAEDFEDWLVLYRKSGEGDWAEVRDAQPPTIAGEGDSWTIAYANLAQYDESGKAYTYAVVETVAQETEYVATYSGTAKVGGEQAALNGETITNTLDAQTQVEFHKAWKGEPAENYQSWMQLYRTSDGETWEPVNDLTETETGTFTATVDKYDESGALYTYAMVETIPAGAEFAASIPEEKKIAVAIGGAEVDGVQTGGTITNTREADRDVTFQKQWTDGGNEQGIRPTTEAFEGWLALYRKSGEGDWALANDGTLKIEQSADDASLWTIAYAGVDKYDPNGLPYDYQLAEAIPEGSEYVAEATKVAEDGTLVNTLEAKIDVTVEKVWMDGDGLLAEDLVPKEVEIQIDRNGAEYATLTLNGENGWADALEGLDKYDAAGKLYVYTAAEVGAADGEIVIGEATYKVDIAKEGYEFTVTNTRESDDPEQPVKTVEAEENEFGMVEVGDELVYTIQYANNLNVPANVTVTDKLPKGVTYIGSEPEGVYDETAHTVTWTIENVEAFAGDEVTVTVVVNKEALVEANPELSNTAEVKVGDHQPAMESDPIKVTVSNPSLALEKVMTSEGPYGLGDKISYRVTVTNDGNLTLNDVVFTDNHVTAETEVTTTAASNGNGTYTIAALEPGDKVTFEYSYEVTSGDILAHSVVNKAKATAKDPTDPGNEITAEDSTETPLEAVDGRFTVTKTSNVTGTVSAGDTIEYTIEVKNEGNVPLHNVTVTELEGVLFGNGTNKAVIEELAVGETVSLTAEYTVTAEDVEAGYVYNHVTAEADDPDPEDPENPDKPKGEDETYDPTKPVKEARTSEAVAVGDELTYTIHYFNHNDEAVTVTIKDKLDEGLDFVSASDEGAHDSETHTVTWTIEDVEAHTSGTVTVTVKVNETAKVQTPEEVEAGVENDATVQVGNRVEQTNEVRNPLKPDDPEQPVKTVDVESDTEVEVGDELTYTIEYYNHHNAAADVTITDKLDPGVDFMEASDEGTYNPDTHTVTWEIKNVTALTGDSVTVKVKVNQDALTIGEDETQAGVSNDATVQIGNDPSMTADPVDNPMQPEDPQSPEKTATAINGVEITTLDGVEVGVGDTITYEIAYRNYTNERKTLTITDKLDPGVDFVAASNGGTYDSDTRKVTWTIRDVDPFTSDSVTLTVEVNGKAKEVGDDEDLATVDNAAQLTIGNTTTTSETVEIPVEDDEPTAPTKEAIEINAVEITTLDGQTVEVGDTITYMIGYTNHTADRAKVTITDKLDDGVDFVGEATGTVEYGKYAYDEAMHAVTWELVVPPFTSGSVTLTVEVNEDAKKTEPGEELATVDNTAQVTIGNEAQVVEEPVKIPLEDDEPTAPTKEATEINDVEITTLDGQTVEVGDTITYEIGYTNHTADRVDVTVRDVLDPGVDLVEANGGTYDSDTRTVTWTIRDVAPFTKGSVTLTVRVNEDAKKTDPGEELATVDNTAYAAIGNNAEASSKPVEIPVEPDDPENPEKTSDIVTAGNSFGMIEVGDQIVYTIEYYNNLNVPAKVTVTDVLDDGVNFFSASNGGTYDSDAHTVTWTIQNVAPFTTGTVTLTVEVNASAIDGSDPTLTNTAQAQVGNQSSYDSEPVEITVYNPDVEIAKEVVDHREDAEKKDYYAVGETVEFEITVTNTGNVTLRDLIVSDEIQAVGEAEIVAGAGYEIDADGNAVIEALEPGQSVVIGAEYVVQVGDLGDEPVVNTASVTAPDPDEPDDPEEPPVEDEDEEEFTPDETTSVTGSKIWNDLDNLYNTRPDSITVRLYADGEEYAVQTVTAQSEWTYEFTDLPTHNADGTEKRYTVSEDAVTGYDTTLIPEAGDGELSYRWDIQNDLQQYTLTVRYWYNEVGGRTAAPTVTGTYYYGQSYYVASPRISGYTSNPSEVSGVITGDVVRDVIYTAIDYTLTIYYVFEDGTTAAPTYTDVLHIYDDYSVASPTLEGYVASRRVVSGTMPARDVVYTVIYVPETVTVEIDEYGVPLNIGSVVMNVGDCFE